MKTLSASALSAIFGTESDDDIVTMLTVTGGGLTSPLYVADNWNTRIASLTTDDEVIYGIVRSTKNFIYVPFQLPLPSDTSTEVPRTSITLYDVTKYLTPIIRAITSPPSILIEVALLSTPNVIEYSIPGLEIGNVYYDENVVRFDLALESMQLEPFPQHTFTPAYFPGMF